MLKTVVCVRFHCGRGFFHEYAAASASHHMNITYLLVLAATEFRKGLVLIQQLCFGSCCFFFRLLLHQFRFNNKKKKKKKKIITHCTSFVPPGKSQVAWSLTTFFPAAVNENVPVIYGIVDWNWGEPGMGGGLDFVLWPQCQDMNFSGDIWGKLDEIPPLRHFLRCHIQLPGGDRPTTGSRNTQPVATAVARGRDTALHIKMNRQSRNTEVQYIFTPDCEVNLWSRSSCCLWEDDNRQSRETTALQVLRQLLSPSLTFRDVTLEIFSSGNDEYYDSNIHGAGSFHFSLIHYLFFRTIQ